MIVFTHDKQRIYWHCRKDPILFGYLLGDLDDRLFDKCQWICVYGEQRQMQELMLLFGESDPPTLMAFGLSDALIGGADELADLLPRRLTIQTNNSALLQSLGTRYTISEQTKLLKMGLESFIEPRGNDYTDAIELLTADHLDELRDFYSLSYPEGFFLPDLLQLGDWYCYRENDRIVGAAGVHVNSGQYQVAVIGGCAVDPGFRGNGIATAVVGHLTAKLSSEGKQISLNVHATNEAAVRCYHKLGFVVRHQFIEASLERIAG